MSSKISQVIRKIRDLRDELSVRRKEFDTYEKEVKEDIDRLSMWLKERADEQGVTSFATDEGTAYKTSKVTLRCDDWSKFIEFVKEHDAYHCIEKRPAKNNTLEVMATLGFGKPVEEGQNEKAFSPSDIGLFYQSEVVMNVRKPSK